MKEMRFKKNAAGVLYIIIKENVLPKPGWYIQIIKSPFFSPNMGFQTDALKHEWIFLMKDAG